MGELSIVVLLAFLAWVAWAIPSNPLEDQPDADIAVFWLAAAVGLVTSLAWWTVRYIARKARGRRDGHL